MPPLIPPQNEPPPGYRGRFDGPPFEDIPPGVEPPVPGFENSPFEKPGFGLAGPMERDRLLPSNFRDPYRAPYGEGPPVYRDVGGIPPVQNEIPPHVVDHPQRFRDNFRPPGHAFRDQGPVPFRDGQSFREPGPQQPYRDNNFRNGPPPLFRDNNYRNNMFREGNFRDAMPHNFRDAGIPFRAPSAEIRDPNVAPYNDPTFRDGYREEVNPNRDMRSGYRSNTRNRPGSRRNPNAEHERHRDGRDRDRFNDNRDQTDRNERSRDVEKRAGFEKGRETREDRVRDYERNRDEKERENRGHDKSPDKKLRTSPKRGREPRERKRSDSRGRSRDRDHRREKKDEKARDKSSADRSREHKEKDKKIKDRKKKKREKEKDIEKKKKRDKKDKKEKDGVKKEDDDDAEKSDAKLNIKEEFNEDTNDKASNQTEHEIQKLDNSNVEAPKCKEPQEVQDDLYGGEEAEAVDKEIIQNYVKNEEKQDIVETKILDSNKEEPFDGIELQPASDELEADIEVASNNKEMLAPLPALSKWEVDDDNVEKSKEPGEITSPEEEEDSTKVTSEVLKRAENAIFAKAINSLRPIEIKKISSDRIKLYGDEGQQKNSVNNIQITVPVTDQEQRMIDINDRKRRYSKTPPPRLSVKERLGGKVDDTRRSREPRIVQSTVERVKSRSKTPKKEQTSYRRVIVEKDRSRKQEQINRIEISKSERHNPIDGSKSDQNFNGNEFKKRDFLKPKDEKKIFGDEKKVCQEKINVTERKKSHERERKKSILDEAHFEPDYDENVESDNETKEESKKRERSQETSPVGPSDSKKVKLEETIKLDLANVKKKPESDSESSSDSEYSSSSSSSDARKRKKKKKRNKKKKKRAASDSDSDSDSSSDDHKKKKKKRKHKKKSSKKKKKYKHK